MDVYEAAFKTYMMILHTVCIISILCLIGFTLVQWNFFAGISLCVSFQGISRLRWINGLKKRAEKEGFNVAEFIFKSDESKNS